MIPYQEGYSPFGAWDVPALVVLVLVLVLGVLGLGRR